MFQRMLPSRQSDGFGPTTNDLFATNPGDVIVSHGFHSEPMPVANMTVGEVRARWGDRFDIDPDSTAMIDANEVDEQTVLIAGQELVFVRRSGAKGR